MRLIELIGLVFLTAVLAVIVIPIFCLPPSCGPEGIAPLIFFEAILVYLYQPITWIIIISWLVTIIIWIRRSSKGKSSS